MRPPLLFCLACLAVLLQQPRQCDASAMAPGVRLDNGDDEYLPNLRQLLSDILVAVQLERCFVVITDDMHYALYDEHFFRRTHRLRTYYFIRVQLGEDLMAPHYQTVRVLQKIREHNCDLHIITLLNGLQVKRLLRFVEKQRILNLQQKFVLLYDPRVLELDMLYIWSNMIESVFLKRTLNNRFLISTVAYPEILDGVVVTKTLGTWHGGGHFKNARLFPNKTANLKGVDLPVVVFEHVPMVMHDTDNGSLVGVEVEILRSLAVALNFRPKFYVTADAGRERWGRELPNGSFTGLLGQMTNRTAKLAIGNLHLYKLYASVMELSRPHSYECLTFLTPESSQDDTWRTLIQPFSGKMWAGVLLSLLVVCGAFYTISCLHALLLHRQSDASCRIVAAL